MARYALSHGRVQSEDSSLDAIEAEKLAAAAERSKRRNRERDLERGESRRRGGSRRRGESVRREESRRRGESRHRGGDLGDRPRRKSRRRSTAAVGDVGDFETEERRRKRSRSRSAPPPPPPKRRCGRCFCRGSISAMSLDYNATGTDYKQGFFLSRRLSYSSY